MRRLPMLAAAGLAGAALMYLLDPDLGHSRRARSRDQLAAVARRAWRRAERGAGGFVRSRRDMARGLATQLTRSPRPDDDAVVLSRVESALFGLAGFPKGQVVAEVVDGTLTLRGEVGDAELRDAILSACTAIRGVERVENLLHRPGSDAPNKARARRTARQVTPTP